MLSRFALLLALLLGASGAQGFEIFGGGRQNGDVVPAQGYERPPAGINDAPDSPDAAEFAMRIDRLERDIRRLTGQNEELQHKVQLLEEQLRLARPEPPRAGEPVSPPMPLSQPSSPAAAPPPASPAPLSNPAPGRRGDAFDPAAQPTAPGAPRQLGTTAASAPLDPAVRAPGSVTSGPPVREVGQPLDIAHGRLVGDQPASAEIAERPPIAPPGPKDEYDLAVASLRAGKYEEAEKSLSAFLTKNGKSKLAPAATFNLGESYFLRGRHREAAEKYLEISTKYAESTQAPEALLRLGQSLSAMGAKEQACASYSEINAKYPRATSRIRDAAQRESKKIQC